MEDEESNLVRISFSCDSSDDDAAAAGDSRGNAVTNENSSSGSRRLQFSNTKTNAGAQKRKKPMYLKPRKTPPREVIEAAQEFERYSGLQGVSQELLHGKGAALRASGWTPQAVYDRNQLCLAGYDTFLEYKFVPFKGKTIVFNRPRPERSWRQPNTEVDHSCSLLFFTRQQSRVPVCHKTPGPFMVYKYYQKRRRCVY